MSERMRELLKNAARCFRCNYSPFCLKELSENNVTADECKDLSVMIANIIEEHLEVTE